MNISKLISLCAILSFFILTSCTKDEDPSSTFTVEITDAPIDNANVSGAFVTVAEVRVDGQAWSGFSGKQTIDLLAYQNGQTKGLGSGELAAGSYSNIELVLDYASDADGNAPGCYVLTDDNTKVDLNSTTSSTGSISIPQSNFDLASNSNTSAVIDFDLRKAIQKGNGAKEYSFKSESKLTAALRAENKATVGAIQGTFDNSSNASGKVVVYAYKKGTYSASEANADANNQFEGAVTSASVSGNGSYTLSFLEEGEYDLLYCNYEDTNNDGAMELTGRFSLDLTGTLTLQTANVSSSSTATVNVTGSALLSF